jgi:cytochrome c-type biogenesis protein CcmE
MVDGAPAQGPPPPGGVAMKRYAMFVIPALGLVAVIVGFLLFNLSDALVYYRTPTEMVEEVRADPDGRMRLGGQVEAGTVVSIDGGVEFVVSDGQNAIPVSHSGAPQQLFQEGIGVVVEGSWDGARFHSDTMIVKHDEQYRTDDGEVYETPHEVSDQG